MEETLDPIDEKAGQGGKQILSDRQSRLTLDSHLSSISAHGWLEKRGAVNVQWKKRYFALWNDSVMYYFSSPEQCVRFFRGHRMLSSEIFCPSKTSNGQDGQ